MITPRSRWFPPCLLLVWAFLAASCDSENKFTGTIPKDGARGIAPRTIVSVGINNSFTDQDTSALDPANFVVTGDLSSAPYQGTLTLAPFKKLSQGMTVEEFQASAASMVAEGETPPLNTAIVFLLATGSSFKEGETITVKVSERVTTHKSPLRGGKTFRFRVTEESSPQGNLQIVATEPQAGASRVPLSTGISARFNRAVRPDELASSIVVRGSLSGVRSGGEIIQSQTQGTGKVLEVRWLPAEGDAFLPGEAVQASFASTIVEAGASGASPPRLIPYVLEFQAAGGQVQDGWVTLDLPQGFDAPAAVVPGDFRPEIPGVELAVVEAGRVTLLFAQGDGWATAETPIPLVDGDGDRFDVAGALAYDVGGDAVPEVVIFLHGATGSRILVYAVGSTGKLELDGKTVDLPARDLRGIASADLDANGNPEILLLHPSVSYVPATGGASKSTGTVTLLELQEVAPDPATINPLDPATLEPSLLFQPVEGPLARAPLASRVEAADLDGDGRLDLIFETSSGLVLHENIGTGAVLFGFREADGKLEGRLGGAAQPLAWTVGDFDGDRDPDIVAWDPSGPLFYENPLRSTAGGTSGSSSLLDVATRPKAIPPDALDLTIDAPAFARALELDGDGKADIVLIEGSGTTSLILGLGPVGTGPGGTGAGVAFQTVALPSEGPVAASAVADVDGDAGLDLVVLAGGDGTPGGTPSRVRFHLTDGVVPPPVEVPSSFSFAPEDSGLTDLSGETIRVAVVGDLKKIFTGYTIALDYDEAVLQYLGYEPPAIFARKATFTLCPNESLQGCSGNASAKMGYNQGTKGAPADDLLLGTFLFKKPTVTEVTTTSIELEAFTGTNSASYRNILAVVDGDAAFDLRVETGAPLVIELLPPAPPDISVTCSVLSRGDDTLSGRVTWTSPSGAAFSEYRVSIGGGAQTVVPGTASAYDFTTSLAGSIQVSVTGRTTAGALVSASCQVIGIHRPAVTCEAITTSENRVTWTQSHAADRFIIWRNGVRIAEVSGSTREYRDVSASTTGADNYSVAAVVSSVEGPRGSCAGGPVGDPDVGTTIPPTITEAVLLSRSTPVDPNALRLRWTNGEGYDSIALEIEMVGTSSPIVSESIDGTLAEYVYRGDASHGGVKPGQYVFGLVGTSRGRASVEVRSSTVNVPVPALATSLACVVDGSGDIRVTWAPIWAGYTGLELRVEHFVDGAPQGSGTTIPLAVDDTSHVVTGVTPVGLWRVRLVAAYDDPLPPPLVPNAGSLQKSCEVSFEPSVRVPTVETGIGLSGIEIPVEALVFGEVQGFAFEIEYPAALQVDPATGLRVDHGGPAKAVSFEIVDGATADKKKAVVRVQGLSIPPDADGDGVADGKVVLASLVGELAPDFSLAGEQPLRFRGSTTLRFAGSGDVPVGATDGKLVIRKRFIWLDEAAVQAGSQETIRLRVRTTFNAPASAPDYRINALQIHLKWDPKKLDLLPVIASDQASTALGSIGTYFLPTDASYPIARANGDLKVSWIGFNFVNPTAPEYLYPGIGLELLVLKFRSLVPGDSPSTFVPVDFVWKPGSELPTALFPEVDVPSEPDLEGFFGGGVEIVSGVTPFEVLGISPTRGALAGGNEAAVTGRSLVDAGTSLEDISILFVITTPTGGTTDLRVEEILEATPTRIRFLVPASGLLNPASLSTPADVEVTTPAGTGTLVGAYAYEVARATGADLTGGEASGGDLLVIQGAGFPPTISVRFVVPGAPAPFAAEVASVAADGSRISVVTPDLRGHEGKLATVEVLVPGLDPIPVPGSYEILPDGVGPQLSISGISPAVGTICGGLEVTIEGAGFLMDLTVTFGAYPAARVEVVDGRTAIATTPSVPEGTGSVTVVIQNGSGPSASRVDGFVFEHPAPPFIRGDVNGDGSVSVSDAVELAAIVVGQPDARLPENLDAADVNDDGFLNGGDVTSLTSFLFAGGSSPPPPTGIAGFDPTPDALTSCP